MKLQALRHGASSSHRVPVDLPAIMLVPNYSAC